MIGVEPHFCASLTAALKAGKPVHADTKGTLADGLAVPTVSETFLPLLMSPFYYVLRVLGGGGGDCASFVCVCMCVFEFSQFCD